jgi:hypothetical protein
MAAVIDSAAEVTILSDKIYNSLQDRPQILRKTVMCASGRGMQMDTINQTQRFGDHSYSLGTGLSLVQLLCLGLSPILG